MTGERRHRNLEKNESLYNKGTISDKSCRKTRVHPVGHLPTKNKSGRQSLLTSQA